MKSILLTTTALVTLFASVTSAHMEKSMEKPMKDSEGLSVSIGGFLNTQAITTNQKGQYRTVGQATPNGLYTYKTGITPGNKNFAFNTDSYLHINVKDKTASGMKYGAQLGIIGTTAAQSVAGNESYMGSFLFVEDEIGRLEAGSNIGVASSMRVGADSIARATGGIIGDWSRYVSLNTFTPASGYINPAVVSTNFVTSPITALTNIEYMSSTSQYTVELARKITYYTPEYNGFQAGITYTPDVTNNGWGIVNANNTSYYTNNNNNNGNNNAYNIVIPKNAISAGLSWAGKFEHNQSLKVAVVGETSQTTVDNIDKALGNRFYDNKSVIVGAEYSYKDISLAASYGNQGKSGLTKNPIPTGSVGLKGGSFWTVGAAYVQGAVGTSLTYMSSELNRNKFNLISLGMDYKLAPGLLPYFEVSYFTMKQKTAYTAPGYVGNNNNNNNNVNVFSNLPTSYKNNGTAFIIGAKLKF
jgi:hypothetical protein